MRPVLFYIGKFPIYSFGFMMLIGFIIGLRILATRFRSKGIDGDLAYDLGLIAIVSGVLGARLLFIIQFNHRFDFSIFDISDGGISLWGGILGALIFFACYRRMQFLFYQTIFSFLLIIARYQKMIHIESGRIHWTSFLFVIFTIFFIWKNRKIWSEFSSFSRKQKILAGISLPFCIFLGSRSVHCYMNASSYSWGLFKLWNGGLVFYGGFLCATFAIFLYLRKKKIPVLKVFDIIAISVALGIGIIRIGCFLNGCCYGGTCDTHCLCGVYFPAGSLVEAKLYLRGIDIRSFLRHQVTCRNLFPPVYPTQLFSSLNGIFMTFILSWFYHKRRHDGEVALMFGIFYSIARFTIECFRSDTNPILGTGLKISQNISVVIFCFCTAMMIFLRGRDFLRKLRSSKTSPGEAK